MQVQSKNYRVEAVVNVPPKDVEQAIVVAVRNALKCNNDCELVILQPLPCVTVEVRKQKEGYEFGTGENSSTRNKS